MKKILIISIIVLSSCSLQQRATNKTEWLKKHGFLKETSDTVILRDTIKGWSYDTIVQFDTFSNTDTLIMSNGKDSIITIVSWRERVIKQTKRELDTIVESKVITNTKPIVIEPKRQWWDRFWSGYILGILSIVFFFIIIYKLIKSLGNKPDNNTH